MDFIWDLHQESRINRLSTEADRASSKADAVVNDYARLQRRVERLALATQAMWELLRDHSSLTEEQLQTKILEVDLRDGKTDGKIKTQITDCPSCKARTNSKRTLCVMCGAPLPVAHSFEV